MTTEGDVTIEKGAELDDVAIGKGAGLDDVGSSSESGSHDEKESEDIHMSQSIQNYFAVLA